MIGSGISLSGGEAICIVEGHGGTVAARTHADDHMLYTVFSNSKMSLKEGSKALAS